MKTYDRGAQALGRVGSSGHNRFGTPKPTPRWFQRLDWWRTRTRPYPPSPMQWRTSTGKARCVRCGEPLIDIEVSLPTAVINDVPIGACTACLPYIERHLRSQP